MRTGHKIAIGVAVAGGAAALLYVAFLRPSAPPATGADVAPFPGGSNAMRAQTVAAGFVASAESPTRTTFADGQRQAAITGAQPALVAADARDVTRVGGSSTLYSGSTVPA